MRAPWSNPCQRRSFETKPGLECTDQARRIWTNAARMFRPIHGAVPPHRPMPSSTPFSTMRPKACTNPQGCHSANLLRSLLQFFQRHVRHILPYQCFTHIPHLQQIILSRACHEPRVILIEAKVGNAVCVATVDEQPVFQSSRQHETTRMNRKETKTYNSGGPSSASSGLCSSPHLARSQNMTRLSMLLLARTWRSNGCHSSPVTASLWLSQT